MEKFSFPRWMRPSAFVMKKEAKELSNRTQ
jgi:hypothetical protein